MIELRKVKLALPSITFSFDGNIEGGRLTAITGPSGSGKTTLLELIAGFLAPDAGEIWIEGKNVTEMEVFDRSVSYAFQQNSLFPHLDIQSNVGLALHDQRLDALTCLRRARDMLEKMGLGKSLWSKKPGELSGGELARANLARALLRPAKVLLLDEPCAALDGETKNKVLQAMLRIHLELKLTTLLVTHDLDDAHRYGENSIEIEHGAFKNSN